MGETSIKEKALEQDVRDEIVEFSRLAAQWLSVRETETPEAVIRKICDHIDEVRESYSSEQLEEAILPLACLWGNQVCRGLGWEWVDLIIDGDEYYSIVSPQRNYAILPLLLFKDYLTIEDRDNTSLLIYNMLVANKFSPANPGDYKLLE
jgi:hypothetical protein